MMKRKTNQETLGKLGKTWSETGSGRLEQALLQARARGPVTDLITATVQDHGILFPPDRLRGVIDAALAADTVRLYRPHAMGQPGAREAVAAWYGRRTHPIRPENVLLTPGTSLGYLLCFRLLCDPGDEILIPSPGYPLFDDLAAIAGVGLRSWHLRQDPETRLYSIDPEEIRFQITPRTRAIVVVSPHNPTGSVMSPGELEQLAAICRGHGIALLFDEVFSEWLAPGETLARPLDDFPLAIRLNGVSKMLALAQWKIAWLAATGEAGRARSFMRAAEHFSDALLAVGELQQAMLPGLLDAEDVSAEIAESIRERRRAARAAFPLPLTSEDRGVYLCGQLHESENDEDRALELLQQHAVLVHPGYFYGLGHQLVATCINPNGWDALRAGCIKFGDDRRASS